MADDRLTDAQKRELRIIADKNSFAPGIADNMRVAKRLEAKGLIELIKEWTEGERGRPGRDYVVRLYRITDAGSAALSRETET